MEVYSRNSCQGVAGINPQWQVVVVAVNRRGGRFAGNAANERPFMVIYPVAAKSVPETPGTEFALGVRRSFAGMLRPPPRPPFKHAASPVAGKRW